MRDWSVPVLVISTDVPCGSFVSQSELGVPPEAFGPNEGCVGRGCRSCDPIKVLQEEFPDDCGKASGAPASAWEGK